MSPHPSVNQRPLEEAAVEKASVKHSILHSFESAEEFHQSWNEVVHRSGADVYQTYEWCHSWWMHYGSGRQLNLILFFSGNDLVGLVPAFVETLWLGPVRIKAAKLIGADHSLQLCNLPVLPDAMDFAVKCSIRHFVDDLKCDIFLIGPLSGPAARIEEVVNSGNGERDLVHGTEVLGNSISTRFELPENFNAYEKMIGSRQRGNFNRSVNQLKGMHHVETDTVFQSDEVMREFENFIALHEKQWTAEGKLGHFGDWPLAEEFNRDLVKSLGRQGMVRFYRILVDGAAISSQFCFCFGGINYWRLPARVCRPEWEKLSLGKMGLIRMVEACIGEGLSIIEGGRGHYDYKVQLGGVEWPLRTIQFTRKGLWVKIRVSLFKACAALLNLVYYKILFVRLAPKFPLIRRSLWPVWIRSTW